MENIAAELQEYATELRTMVAGNELDEQIALKLLGFQKSGIFQNVVDRKGKAVGTSNWKLDNGQPVFLPPVSQDVKLAEMLVMDLKRPIPFGFDGSMFYTNVKGYEFTGVTFGEALSKGLLYELEYEKLMLKN